MARELSGDLEAVVEVGHLPLAAQQQYALW